MSNNISDQIIQPAQVQGANNNETPSPPMTQLYFYEENVTAPGSYAITTLVGSQLAESSIGSDFTYSNGQLTCQRDGTYAFSFGAFYWQGAYGDAGYGIYVNGAAPDDLYTFNYYYYGPGSGSQGELSISSGFLALEEGDVVSFVVSPGVAGVANATVSLYIQIARH